MVPGCSSSAFWKAPGYLYGGSVGERLSKCRLKFGEVVAEADCRVHTDWPPLGARRYRHGRRLVGLRLVELRGRGDDRDRRRIFHRAIRRTPPEPASAQSRTGTVEKKRRLSSVSTSGCSIAAK